MRRRQLTLLFLLLAGLAAWLARPWWLRSLLAQLPRIEEGSDLIQALDGLVSIVVLVVNGVLAYLLWLSRSRDEDDQDWEMEPLRPITVW